MVLNVYKGGKVYLSILHNLGVDKFNEQEKGKVKVKERWSPSSDVEQVIISVISLHNAPNYNPSESIDTSVI